VGANRYRFFRSILCAQLELEIYHPSPRAYHPNDEFDIARLAVGLCAADVILTDRKMAQLCNKAKIDQDSKAAVFGMPEIAEALAYIRGAI
jgi:hypothetical protein